MLSYIDDNTISNSGSTTYTITEVLKRTQYDSQMWNDILCATGGSLNLSKCFCQAITYIFARSGAPVVAPTNPEWKIIVKDDRDNSEQIINAISPYKAYKSLGPVQGISTENNKQHLVLDDKAKTISK